jgi:hypothetical protein
VPDREQDEVAIGSEATETVRTVERRDTPVTRDESGERRRSP